MKFKCPECKKIYDSSLLGVRVLPYGYTGSQKLPSIICQDCRDKNKNNKWVYENTKQNKGEDFVKLPPPDRIRRGLTEDEWKSRHRAIEAESNREHRGESHAI